MANQKILANYRLAGKKGMPLGNLTSQFFANVYLNGLDNFVKHKVRAKYYLRYVDDFVILHKSKETLEIFMHKISTFLKDNLNICLHPEKSKIIDLSKGISFLGMRIFPYYRLITCKNLKRFKGKLADMCAPNDNCNYDDVYDFLEGWCAYAKHASTYKLRQSILCIAETNFRNDVASKEINRYLKASA